MSAQPALLDRSEPEQLHLRLLAIVKRFRGIPPERALWRELLELALRDRGVFPHGGRSVAASAVWAVGAACYFRSNEAGVIDGFSVETIAADCRLSERTVKIALAILRDLRVIKTARHSRRRPARHLLNVGGLTWAVVRRRIMAPSGDTMSLLDGPSGDMVSPLDGPSGDTMSPLKGYGEDQQQQHDPNPQPTEKQIRGIRDMEQELGAKQTVLRDRAHASDFFRSLKDRINEQRAEKRKRANLRGQHRLFLRDTGVRLAAGNDPGCRPGRGYGLEVSRRTVPQAGQPRSRATALHRRRQGRRRDGPGRRHRLADSSER